METRFAAVSSPGKYPLQRSQRKSLSRPSWPLEGCFAAKQPLQGAHGLCSGQSMTRLSRRNDFNAAVANLVIEGALHVCPRKADCEAFLFGDRGKPGATLQGDVTRGTPTSSHRKSWLFFWAVAFLPPALSLLPWTGSMDCLAAVDHVLLLCHLPNCAYKRRATTTVAGDRLRCTHNHLRARKTKTFFFSFLVIHHSQK